MNLPRIQIFLKAPRPGFVKTRLAASIGDDLSLGVYRQLVSTQFSHLPPDWPVEIHYTPADAGGELLAWIGEGYPFFPQPDGNLGNRLSHAVGTAFKRNHAPVFCIGADCPELVPSIFHHAANLLLTSDLVFGPTLDGGYYLVGMKAHHHCIFEDIPWSSSETLAVSVRAAKANGLTVAILPELRDIDTGLDLAIAMSEGLLPAPGAPRPRSAPR